MMLTEKSVVLIPLDRNIVFIKYINTYKYSTPYTKATQVPNIYLLLSRTHRGFSQLQVLQTWLRLLKLAYRSHMKVLCSFLSAPSTEGLSGLKTKEAEFYSSYEGHAKYNS